MSDLTPADMGAVMGNRDNGYNDWFWIIIILFAFWGNGFNNNNDLARESSMNSQFTQRDIFNTNQNVSTTGAEINSNICNTRYDLATNILENRYANQLGQSNTNQLVQSTSCATDKEILQSRYDNSLQTQTLASQLATCCCDLKTAIHEEGEATRSQMQNDKIEELRASLNTASNAYNNVQLANSIVNSLRPYPVPAYVTASPYTGYYSGYGCTGTTVV